MDFDPPEHADVGVDQHQRLKRWERRVAGLHSKRRKAAPKVQNFELFGLSLVDSTLFPAVSVG